MKSCIAFILFILCTTVIANAQCPGMPVTLSTQSQVNNFPSNYPGCTEMNVSLTIQGTDIANLNGLSGLNSITKSLFIKNCPALTSVAGLSNLSNIGVELTFDNCDALTSFNGLQNLPFIGGTLTITGNAVLSDISALSGIAYINGSLLISLNPALTSLNGLNNVAFTGRFLQISNNNALSTLNSLNGLTQVGNNPATTGRYLSITSNPNLTTLNGLSSLQSVGTDFEIANNGKLASLNAFGNLETVGGQFSITNNPLLTSVTDFASLSSVAGTLTISNNNILSDCAAQGICDFLDGPGTAIISNNDPGCNSVAEVEAECLILPVELLDFEGEQISGAVLLTWRTASEQDNAYFQLEHSLDGHKFKPIGQLQGKGTTQSANTYRFEHRNPASGSNYYRLKQVDRDGKFHYSNIAYVELERDEPDIYPNPTTGSLFIKKGKAELCSATLTDIRGRTIWQKTLSDGDPIDLSGQPEGIYFIEIQTDIAKTVKKVLKE